MRKEVTKKQFVRLCFTLIGIGILLMSIMYYFGTFKGWTTILINWLSVSLGIIGVGIGLSVSRMWKIKDFD
jgi:fatty-acid desaturase